LAEVGDGVDEDMNGPRRGEGSPARVVGPGALRTGVTRRILVGGTLAALFGVAVAVGGAWVAGLDSDDAETPDQGLAPPVSPAGNRPSTRANDCSLPLPTGYNRIDSRRSPEITDITAIDRTTVRLRWVDRSGRVDLFIVSRLCQNGRAMTSRLVPYSDTEYVFSGLDPATAPYCFKVEALNTDSGWESERRCISRLGESDPATTVPGSGCRARRHPPRRIPRRRFPAPPASVPEYLLVQLKRPAALRAGGMAEQVGQGRGDRPPPGLHAHKDAAVDRRRSTRPVRPVPVVSSRHATSSRSSRGWRNNRTCRTP